MTNRIRQFVAGRATPQQINNVADTVSKADFDKLVSTVNTMAKAVEGLIEDFDTVASPEKLQALVNTAFKGLPTSTARPPLALPSVKNPLSQFKAPADDATDMQVNKDAKGRAPLALPADGFSYLAPKGD